MASEDFIAKQTKNAVEPGNHKLNWTNQMKKTRQAGKKITEVLKVERNGEDLTMTETKQGGGD